MTQVPMIDLSDGAQIPQLGFGTFQIDPSDAGEAVARALDVGYRGIVTEAWSPLAQGELCENETLTEIGSASCQDDRAGDAPLAYATRKRDDPEVGHP